MVVHNTTTTEEPGNIHLSLSLVVGAASILGNALLIHASRLQCTADRYIHWFVTSLGTAGLIGGLVFLADVIFYFCHGHSNHLLFQLQVWFLQTQQVASVGSVLLVVSDRYLLAYSTIDYG